MEDPEPVPWKVQLKVEFTRRAAKANASGYIRRVLFKHCISHRRQQPAQTDSLSPLEAYDKQGRHNLD